MTKLEMARLGKEYRKNYFRSDSEYFFKTEESKRIRVLLDTPMFTCPCCGKLVSFNSLEQWLVDTPEEIANNECPCSICYEDEMGDDL